MTDTSLHLAPAGAHKCDYGTSIDQSECEAAVRSFAESTGNIPGRSLQVGSGGSCNFESWGQVPLGCSAQSGDDWASHYKTNTDTGDGCISSIYQLVCAFTGTVYFLDLVQYSHVLHFRKYPQMTSCSFLLYL